MDGLVSIIIASFNSEMFLEETLNSIKNQDYIYFECIIVDDGSWDESKHIAQEFTIIDDRFSYYERPLNYDKGSSGSRNFGLTKATGIYIQFFDSDDIMLHNHLFDKIAVFREDDSIDLVINEFSFYENGKITHNSNIKSNRPLIDSFLDNIEYHTFGPLWKHSFIKENNVMFDFELSNMEDWDFNIRLLLFKPKIVNLNTSTILYRQSQNSLIKEIAKGNPKEIKSEITARLKILHMFESEGIDTIDIKKYLKFRFRKLYRICLENKEFEMASFCYVSTSKVLKLTLLEKIKLKVAYYTYKLFNKGYVLLE